MADDVEDDTSEEKGVVLGGDELMPPARRLMLKRQKSSLDIARLASPVVGPSSLATATPTTAGMGNSDGAATVPGPRTVCPGQPAQASCAAICRASVLSSLPQQATLHIFATARMQSGNLVAQSSGQGSGVQDQERVKTNWTNWAWAKIKCPNAASNSKLLQKI